MDVGYASWWTSWGPAAPLRPLTRFRSGKEASSLLRPKNSDVRNDSHVLELAKIELLHSPQVVLCMLAQTSYTSFQKLS